MYLARVEITNFRIFGAKEDGGPDLSLDLQRGLNVLVGENDSGKTCIIDAIRLLVGTVTQDYFSVQESDFHVPPGTTKPRESLTILGEFRGLSAAEAGALLGYLSVSGEGPSSEFYLRMWLEAKLDTKRSPSPRRRPVSYDILAGPTAGPDDEGKRIEGAARDLLRATYLKPLRDAVSEMAARRGSRLSQVLRALPAMKDQDECRWNPDDPDCPPPKTLLEIMKKAEHDLGQVDAIRAIEKDLNESYLRHLSVGGDVLSGDLSMSAHRLQSILERMELNLQDVVAGGSRGLGISNLLYIATELLALSPVNDEDPEFPLLLIEEPEAHLEPQRQMKLIEFLSERSQRGVAAQRGQMQVVLTTHSPNLASKIGVRDLVVMSKGRAFRMGPESTLLEQSDYEYLERFLDVTKSNMFFARGVLIVEGDAEALLLPVFADKIGRPLTKHGVSIVNVGSTGLFRFARVFQRRQPPEFPVRVACLADRDIPPKEAKTFVGDRLTENEMTPAKIKEHVDSIKECESGPVIVRVSPYWTLEHDLARTDLAPYVHVAAALAKAAKPTGKAIPADDKAKTIIGEALAELEQWTTAGAKDGILACRIYEPLHKKQASKAVAAQCLAKLLTIRCAPRWTELEWRTKLPSYLVEAIDHATGVIAAAKGQDAATSA